MLAAVADNHRRWFRARGGENGIWTLGRNDELGVHDQPEIVTAARRLGVDPDARDDSFHATPAGWAEHLGRPHLLPLFLMRL